MFKIESYVTPILLSYVDKYVRDFKPADAQVSLWGGGVALHNLVLKADVLQQEVALPFTLVSGRIHELLIQVPWTKIMSEPIVVTIDTIECVLSLHPPAASDESLPPESPSRKPQVVEAPPGYMQALVRRIVSNISLRVHHLIVKYVQDDIVLSLNVKHLSVESAGLDWQPTFADIDQSEPIIRRLVRLDDLTLCLDRADSDGKIRFYQEPLLYRCQLDLRVLTRLVSASTRRASNLSVQLRSSKLAWSVTSEQLTLLLRLLRERTQIQITTPPPAPKQSATNLTTPLHATSANSAEPVRSESWSEWAWSWLPTWMDKEGGVEEATLPPTPIPIFFTAYFDHVSLVFKVLEIEGGSRKRARGVLELSAAHAAARAALCAPTALRVRFGARTLRLASHGKCVCGMQNLEALNEKPTIYLDRKNGEDEKEPWTWPAETLEYKVELAEAAEEECSESPNRGEVIEPNIDTTFDTAKEDVERKDDEDLWRLMSPVVFLEYSHVRSPPTAISNPYDSPPIDFQYSDWEEDNNLKINIKPLDIRLCMGLIHRLSAVRTIFQDLPPVPSPDIPMRTLTVEECEALYENLPQRRMNINVQGLRVRMIPWDHSLTEKPTLAPLVLDVEVPQARLTVSLPLYPHRVCSAACQMPKDEGPLWQGARLHVSATLTSIEARLCAPGDSPPRPVARADLRAVLHVLLHPEMFARRDTVNTSYSVKIHELNTCGSAARLQAAWQVVESLIARRPSLLLRYTELAKDALNDEESVAIDATIEDLSVRGFITRQINTHIVMIQSARVMAFHSPSEGRLKQAWLFSAPDLSTSTSFLRVAVQWCEEQFEDSLDYIGVWSEPMAACMDPLFIAWLGYKPQVKATSESLIGPKSSSQFYLRRRATPPSSSGRGASRTGSGSELVHAVRPRSGGSSSEPGEPRAATQPQPAAPRQSLLQPERLLQLHARLQRMLVSVELGMVLLYFTASSASAVDCATLRDAMERHAAVSHHVLAFSVGKVTFNSNVMMKYLWNDIRHDGPTLRTQPSEENQENMDSFPWKLRLGDVSCYTVEARDIVDTGRERATGLRSQLKIPSGSVKTRTVLEPVTTTVTLSVVTKTMQIRSWTKPQQDQKTTGHTPEETRIKYFTTGVDFKPSTLKEFVRGPSKRRKPSVDPQPQDSKHEPTETTIQGPVVSIGVHLHADTPPITVRLEQDQVHTVAAAVHCLRHLHILMHRSPLTLPRQPSSHGSSHRSLIRSVSELDEQHTPSDENLSENPSELVPIFESHGIPEVKLRKFFWFQWVVGRATLVVASDQVKLAIEIDDIISTIDLQEHYNQLKVKVASASVRHHKKNSNDEWTAGVLGGRVLEAREPTEAIEENHFLAVTITQAQISTLPDSWKEELNPKLLENKSGLDSMWEIYATLAPLEAVLQPDVLENILSLYQEMAPPSFCPLQTESEHRSSAWQWPFCYVTAGGLRLLVTTEHKDKLADDTFLFIVGKITVTPYPENPICRRAVTGNADNGWAGGAGSLEGRQYEVYIKNVAIQSAQFNQIVQQETSEMRNSIVAGSENPAVKWTQPPVSPIVTPILHAVEINSVIAPALYIGGGLACGPALELNLASDCAIELSVEQITLAHHVVLDAKKALSSRSGGRISGGSEAGKVSFGFGIYICLLGGGHGGLLGSGCKAQKGEDRRSESFPVQRLSIAIQPEEATTPVGVDRSFAADSGVDINTSKSSRLLFDPTSIPKKSVSIAFIEDTANASDYLEIFVTMGMIELSLYVVDDNSPEIVALRPPSNASVSISTQDVQLTSNPEQVTLTYVDDLQESNTSKSRSRSLTDTIRNADIGQTKLDLNAVLPHARKCEGNLPLFHLTLHQPNLYYWKKKTQCNLQVSLFNAWVGLGAGEVDGFWGEALLSTAKGVPDPVTDIPPALATVKVVVPSTGSTPYMASSTGSCKGTISVDIERPVLFEISGEKLRRLKLIIEMRLFESITIKASQVGVSGCEGTVGWDSASLQVAVGLRSERLTARAHVAALLAAAGPPGDSRHLLMQPLMLGVEGGASAHEPCVHLAIDLDRVTLDVRPEDLAALKNIKQTLEELRGEKSPPMSTESTDSIFTSTQRPSAYPLGRGASVSSLDSTEVEDHYYKDDLKSGAFKIVTGGQMPMAYQVMLYGDTVSWRYPHPRTITKITVNPVPDVDEEVNCVLELYNSLLRKWEPHTYIKLPVAEPREINIYVRPPDIVFAIMWRIRAHVDNDKEEPPFEFQVERFLPRDDPLTIERGEETPAAQGDAVSAEQLWSALRVDSYFAPRLLPRVRVALRCTELELHLHNSLPNLTSQATALEGYYVSRPLMRSHRVLSVVAGDATAHALLGSPAGRLLLLDTKLLDAVLKLWKKYNYLLNMCSKLSEKANAKS
ncbi:hypothetical protein MSG28_000769 [Choristoneura fumiferana]|uniref:Uncharacterized protein n=1 Tax=Choristoneura fumiferana TaxID=7141 RepID=A0ACC0K2P4_CHOFU|nr:hypothetical protein MSG28_000769 [Choristoneura fumiferana]